MYKSCLTSDNKWRFYRLAVSIKESSSPRSIREMYKFGKYLINEDFIVFTRWNIAVLLYKTQSSNVWIWLVIERNKALMDIKNCLVKIFIMSTRSTIAILNITRAITPSSMSGSSRFQVFWPVDLDRHQVNLTSGVPSFLHALSLKHVRSTIAMTCPSFRESHGQWGNCISP